MIISYSVHITVIHYCVILRHVSKNEFSFFSCSRSGSDFEIGLGSFSLLEEIVKGQEWAKFINPNLSPTSINHRPSEQSQPKVQPYPHNNDQSAGTLNQVGGGSNQWSFRITEQPSATGLSIEQSAPHTFLPGGMNVSEGNQQQSVGIATFQSEAMEDGHNHSDIQCGGSRHGLQLRPPPLMEVRYLPLYSNINLKYNFTMII